MAQEEIRLSREDGRKIAEMWNWFISSARHVRPGTNRRSVPSGATFRVVETIGEHAQGASANCTVLSGDKGGETDSGNTILCYNPFIPVPAETRCIAMYVVNGWELLYPIDAIPGEGETIVRGYLDEALGSSPPAFADMSVWEWTQADGWHDTGTTVKVVTRGVFPAQSGVYCVACGPVTETFGDCYEVINLGCA